MAIEKVKLLFFCSKLEGGGAEKHLVRVLNKTDFHRYEIHLALSRAGGAYEAELDKRVVLHYLTKSRSSTLSLFRSYQPLKKLIKKLKPALAISMLDRQNVIFSWLKKYDPAMPPTVLCCQNAVSKSLGDAGLLGKWFLSRISGLYNRHSMIIALSKGVKQELITRFGITVPIEVIYNAGFDEDIDDLRSAKTTMPYLEPAKTVLVAAGRLTRQKGFDVLLQALSEVKNKKFHLLLLGNGADRKALEGRAAALGLAGCISFMGFQQNPYPFFGRAEIFVLSSRWEGFGNVITEAMMCDCAIISTDCNYGPGEIISDGKNGLLVPVEDGTALAQAIEKLMDDKARCLALAKAGKLRAADFSPTAISADYFRHFNDLIAQKP